MFSFKKLQATVFLGVHFIMHILRRLSRRGQRGYREFIFSYRQDGVFPLTVKDTELLRWLEKCLDCHLCDLACPAALDSYFARPSWVIKSATRSLPAWKKLVIPDGCLSCRGCETLCPVEIPIATAMAYLKGTQSAPVWEGEAA